MRPMQSIQQGRVTISIVSHGQREFVCALLEDLNRVRPPAVARIVVTLNIDEPAPALVGWPGCEMELIRNRVPQGFGANHNQAVRECETDWIAILNPDLRLRADPFAPMLATARPDDGLLVPRVMDSFGRQADFSRRLLTPWQLLLRTLGMRDVVPPQRTDWLVGAFQLVRRSAFEQIGGFDQRYFLYLEDADLCLRLKLAGWNLRCVDRAQVQHEAQRRSRSSPRYFRWHVASLLKHWRSAVFWRYLLRRRSFATHDEVSAQRVARSAPPTAGGTDGSESLRNVSR